MVAAGVEFLISCTPFDLTLDRLVIREFDSATGSRLSSGRLTGPQEAVSYIGKASSDIKRMITVTVSRDNIFQNIFLNLYYFL